MRSLDEKTTAFTPRNNCVSLENVEIEVNGNKTNK